MALTRDQVLEWSRQDLLFFSNFFLPRRRKFSSAMHRRIAEFIEKAVKGEIPNSMLIGPPNCGKSTLWRDAVVREALFNRNVIVLGVTEAMPEARNWTREVRRCFDEPRIADYFGAVVDPEWDTLEGFSLLGRTEFSDDPNVSAVGMGGPLQRKHAGIIVGDDCFVLKNQKNVSSRDYLIQWFTRILSRRTKIPGKGTHLVNNRLMRDDCTARLEEGFYRGSSLVIPAEDEQGRSVCPELWPDEAGPLDEAGQPLKTLGEIREEMNRSGEGDYEIIYLCQPFSEGDAAIPSAAFLYYPDHVPLPGKLKTRWGVDPGGTGDRGKRTAKSPWFALVRVGCSEDSGSAYVLDAYQRRCGIHEQEQIFVEMWRLCPGIATFERNNIGVAFKETCEKEGIPHRAPHINTEDHEFRVAQLKRWMQGGRLVFPGGVPTGAMRSLIQQLRKAPEGNPHDLVDALYYAVEGHLTRRRREGVPALVRERPSVGEREPVYFQETKERDGRAAGVHRMRREVPELRDPERWARIVAESPY